MHSLDRYNSAKNTHLPGEYGSIYIYKDDFQSLILLMNKQSNGNKKLPISWRDLLKQQLELEEKQRKREANERKKNEEMYREADEKIKNLNKDVKDIEQQYHDIF